MISLTANIHCFQASQIVPAMLGPIGSYREFEDTWKSAPALAYQVGLTPFAGNRVRMTVAERNFQQYWMAVTGFSLAPDDQTFRRLLHWNLRSICSTASASSPLTLLLMQELTRARRQLST